MDRHTLFLWAALGLALAAAPQAAAANETLQRAVEGALKGLPAKAKLGVRFETLEGKVLYERNSKRPLLPASNMKLFTTTTALHRLGPGFQHETRLVLAGGRQGGKVHTGDLWLVGGGDPTLSFRFDSAPLLDTIVQAFKAAGISRVEGSLVIDARVFDDVRLHPRWETSDAEHWYGAEVSGLVLNDNCLDVTVKGGPRASLAPSTDYVRLVLQAKSTTARNKHNFSIQRTGSDKRTITVRGKVWTKSTGLTRSIPVPDPAAFYGVVLSARLANAGITVTGALRKAGPKETTPAGFTIWRRVAPLPRTLGVINQRSHNLYAECLFKTLGRLDPRGKGAKLQRQGSWPHGAEVVTRFVRSELGLPSGEVTVSDGSGLSRGNRASPRALCRVLRAALNGPNAKHFHASMAQPGQPGTLKRRLRKLPQGVTVRAKTGTLSGVSALSGVLERGERRVVFSLLMNGPGTSRRHLDRILLAAAKAVF
ncbi:MAG: D-alanyl-D-alanine carboxypeptidase/D-alanyl-D-alanine-endopeptidase [Planctomycetes bacterium]|nr:D-alanyl-D-alanine carboxypeptidase/D-alanyl-D-alanine-endopeptidase [Planctomycetota bacterium]